MELYTSAHFLPDLWLSKRWIDNGPAPWFDENTVNLSDVRAYGGSGGYLPSSVNVELFCSFE